MTLPGKRSRTTTLSGGQPLPPAMLAKWRSCESNLSTSFCDIALDVGGRRFYAHRLVLACASEHLATLLLKNTAGVAITVPAVHPNAFGHALNFVYTGACTVEDVELPAVLKAAALLRLSPLLEAATAAATERIAAARTPRSPKRQLSPPSPRLHSGAMMPPPLPQPPRAIITQSAASTPSRTHGRFLYILGGLHSEGSAERLDLTTATDRWEPLDVSGGSTLPCAGRRGVAVVAVGCLRQQADGGAATAPPRLLACGGHVVGSDAVADAVDVLDLNSGAWSHGPSLATARAYAGVAKTADGTVYVLGGHAGGNERLASGEVLRRGWTSWAPIAPMHTARAYFGCAMADDGKLYVAGGHDGSRYLASCEVYDPTKNTWSPLAPLGGTRAYLGLQALGGRLYAIGGHDGDARVPTVEVYDAAHDTWRPIAPLSVARAFLATASDGVRLYALGGSDLPRHGLASCECYDPAEPDGGWRDVASMREPRCFPGAAVA